MRKSRVVAAAVAALLLVSCSSGNHASQRTTDVAATTAAAATPTAPPLTTAQASALSQQLTVGTDAALRQAIAVPSGQAVDPQAARQLAAMGPITFDISTFHALDAGTATVVGTLAHPPAGQPARWKFTLVFVDKAWRISNTEPVL
jgi:PBP1b-binding outer membrane lipoprotein LpoB